ncbi:MAG: hypothetical protein ACQET3_01970 [Promethearchaeati archaeon]
MTYAALVTGLLVWFIGRFNEKRHFDFDSDSERKTKYEGENRLSKDVWLRTTIDCDFGTVPQTAGPARTLNVTNRKNNSKKP